MNNPRSTAQIAGHPIHPMLIPFPIAFFVGAAAADLAYAQTQNTFWFVGAEWLLGAGLVMAALAAIVGVIDVAGDRRVRDLHAAWAHAGANVLAVLLELYNLYIRYSDGPAAASTGLVISLIVVVLLVISGWLGGELVYKHRVGVPDEPGIADHR